MPVVPLRFALTGLLLTALTGAHAQYKVVGPDGKVTYTDQAPSTAGQAQSLPQVSGGGVVAPNLPGELRRVVDRYPVTLYAGKHCGPCDSGRQLLQSRGIPFTEKRVESAADINAFMALMGSGTIPALSIGQQRLKGLVSSEWQSYLDAAGYPKASVLPSNYRNPDPSPLTSPAPAAASVPAPPRPAAPDAAHSPSVNPPGTPNIRF